MGMMTIMMVTKELKYDLISKSSIIIMRFYHLAKTKAFSLAEFLK